MSISERWLFSISVLAGLAAATALAESHFPGRYQPATSSQSDPPDYCQSEHSVGRLVMPVTNIGTFGQTIWYDDTRDCFSGHRLTGYCEFPKRSYQAYMWAGGLWVGAVIGRDTLVSTSMGDWGMEFQPDIAPFGKMIFRSTLDPLSPRYEDAVSEQDFIANYTDTCTTCPNLWPDVIDNRPHRPLHIEVTRSSYAWSYSYSQDFILFDYSVKNIGRERLRQIYLGVFVDADVSTTIPHSGGWGGRDDLCGFREWQPAFYLREPCPPDSDMVNMAWIADNNGEFHRPQEFIHVPHITGCRIVRTPYDSTTVSFNWWSTNWQNPILDFGPQARATYRDLGFGNLGTPWGDRNKYHFLRNGEKDYDQARVGTIGALDAIWVQPPADWIDSVVAGLDSRYLLSFGPFGLDPGQTLPFTMAYVAGAHFHRDPDNEQYLPDYPELWYENVNFDSLGINAIWAEWIYDNPGVDTDSDGYAGEFRVCNLGEDSTLLCDTLIDTTAEPDTPYVYCYWAYDVADTIWHKGDGVPDFKGAAPPPNPSTYVFINRFGDTCRGLRVYPETGRVRAVWNGVMSENTPDPFTRRYDFEGYRVYVARDDRPSSYSVVDSYDRENYNRWEWSSGARQFILRHEPFSLQQLRCLYGDSCTDTTWHPDHYPRTHPLVILGGPKGEDKVYFFEPQDYNRSILANDPINATTRIKKVFPDAPKPPHIHPDSIAVHYPNRDDTLYFTEDGYLKYYEYEFTFDGLLPTVPYYFNVTAFDYGFPDIGLLGLESNPALLPKAMYPLPSSEAIVQEGLNVIVYPNPYRLDGDYRDRGFEGRERWDIPEDKTRLVHFANLPPRCTIRIFSLDGDLIRDFEHNVNPLDYLANHATWDLINRNMQLVVSGLYYWVVEDDRGNTQIGKLVVIM